MQTLIFGKVVETQISWLMRCLGGRRSLDDRQILLSKHRDGLCQIGSRSLQVYPGPEFRSNFQLDRINTAATMTAVGLHDIATHIALFFVGSAVEGKTLYPIRSNWLKMLFGPVSASMPKR